MDSTPLPQAPSDAAVPVRADAWPMRWALVPLVAVFVTLALIYNATTPVFEAPGETSHYLYAQALADGRGLPWRGVTPGDTPPEEPLHPPLYHALGALIISAVDVGDTPAYASNPYANLGQADLPGNKNAVLHLGNENWPYRGVSLAVHLLRLLSTVFGAGIVVLTWMTVRLVLPRRPLAPLGAAGLVALNPQFLFISAAVTNDAAAALLACAALYLALRISIGQGPRSYGPVALGALIGLGLLTKASLVVGLALLPLAYAGDLWRRRSEEPNLRGGAGWDRVVRASLIGLASALVIAGWWYVLVFLHSGDPPSVQAFGEVLGQGGLAGGAWRALRLGVQSIDSFWGVFGWANVRGEEAYYVVMRLVTAAAAIGMLMSLAWAGWMRRGLARLPWNTVGLVAIWVLLSVGALVLSASSLTGPQGRYLFPAVSGIALLLTMGLGVLVPRRVRVWLLGGLNGALLVVAVVAPWRYVAPAYAAPVRVTLDEAPATMDDVGVRFGEDVFLLGHQIGPSNVVPAHSLSVRLYWLALGAMDEDLTVSLRVYGRDDAMIGQLDSFSGMGNYPTSLWVPGEVLYDDYLIPIAADAQVPTAASVRVGLYRRDGLQHLTALDAAGNDVGSGPQIARVRVVPERANVAQPARATDLQFGDGVALEGYDAVRRGDANLQTLDVTLYWRRVGPLSEDWTVFVHLLDEVGNLVAQDDQQPAGGYYPTSFWDLNERVVDAHSLVLPADLPPGSYQVHVGLYLLGSEERLPVTGEASQGNYALLGPVELDGSTP